MIEMTTNPTAQKAILRAHQERGKAIRSFWKWVLGSR